MVDIDKTEKNRKQADEPFVEFRCKHFCVFFVSRKVVLVFVWFVFVFSFFALFVKNVLEYIARGKKMLFVVFSGGPWRTLGPPS